MLVRLCVCVQVAARSGLRGMVQALASRGADLNVKGTWRIATGAAVTLQALQVAAASGHEDVVLSLLSREAIKVDATVKGGRTVLHVAASCGQDRVVRRLLLNEQVTVSIHRNREACVGRGVMWGGLGLMEVCLCIMSTCMDTGKQRGVCVLWLMDACACVSCVWVCRW